MSFSLIGKSIKQSATLRLNEIAAILKQKGEPLIHLGGGEPKSKAPIDAIVGAVSNVNTGETRYAPADGTREMKQAAIRYTEEWYGFSPSPENVIISSGAKQTIMVALQAILDPQDEVVYPAPYWVSYPEMVKLCGAIPVPVYAEDGSFVPRLKDIEDHCTSYTKAIMINSPNNPSGSIYPEEFIADIVDFCEKKGYWLIMDDIYHRLTFTGVKWYNPWNYVKDHSENNKMIIVNGVSKSYAMTGYRIGWGVMNKRLWEIMANIQGHQTSGPSVVLQKAAAAAVNGRQTPVEALRTTLENNAHVMNQQLHAFDGINFFEPKGTFYTFADFSNYMKDSTKLAEFLLEKVRVAVVPGVEFGMEGWVRLSTCGTVKDIIEGIERMKWALDPNSPNELYIGDRKLVRDWS